MSKLGLWNRLALVVSVIALLVAPLYAAFSKASAYEQMREARYQLCLARAKADYGNRPYSADLFEAETKCRDERFDPNGTYKWSWGAWQAWLLITASACALLWLLLAGVVWSVKWVWRGRLVNRAHKNASGA